jgi:hypothetical protein
MQEPTIPKRRSPSAETFADGRIASAHSAETCAREGITAFYFIQVLWLIIVVAIVARQASSGCTSGPAVIARRQQVVVESPLEPGSRAAASYPAPTSSDSSSPDHKLPPIAIQSPPKQAEQFAPSLKKGKKFDVADGIIAHMTRECGGNLHDRRVVDVTCGAFCKETEGANPH